MFYRAKLPWVDPDLVERKKKKQGKEVPMVRQYDKIDVIRFIYAHFPFWPEGVEAYDDPDVVDYEVDFDAIWALFGAWCDTHQLEPPVYGSTRLGRLLCELGVTRLKRRVLECRPRDEDDDAGGATGRVVWMYSFQGAYRQTGLLNLQHYYPAWGQTGFEGLGGFEGYRLWCRVSRCVPCEEWDYDRVICDHISDEFDLLSHCQERSFLGAKGRDNFESRLKDRERYYASGCVPRGRGRPKGSKNKK